MRGRGAFCVLSTLRDAADDTYRRLREVKAAETKKLAREEARNILEAFIYRVRDLVDESSFVEVSLEAERKAIKEKTEAANEWLWDEADTAATRELRAKKTELECVRSYFTVVRGLMGWSRKLVKHVSTRSAEASQRPRVIDAFNVVLLAADAFVSSGVTNNTVAEKRNELPKYTMDELKALAKLGADAKEWLVATLKAQEALAKHEDPVLKVADLKRRAKEIDAEITKLRKKKAPRKPRSSASTSTSTAATAAETEVEEPTSITSSPVEEPTGGGHKKDEL